MDLQDKVKSIVLDILDISEPEFAVDASLRSKLGASSVDLVEIIAALENEFDLDISDEEAQTMQTPGEIAAFVETKVV